MLTENEIREVIKARLKAINGQTNRGLFDHNDGVFRGLLWALTGEDHGCYLTKDTTKILTAANIPFSVGPDDRVWI